MTWENDKNETATQIYSFIADFDEKIYANEERREDSLIQQAAHMQTAFVDEVNDAKLLALASERMAMADSSQFVPAERLYEELGITQDDLDTVGDVDIE